MQTIFFSLARVTSFSVEMAARSFLIPPLPLRVSVSHQFSISRHFCLREREKSNIKRISRRSFEIETILMEKSSGPLH